MQIIEAILLGIVQGLTEFIPVSSSGHLIIAEELFNTFLSSFVFDVALNIGTIAALMIYFRKDILNFLHALKPSAKGTKERKLLTNVVIATIPAVIGGVLLQSLAESTFRALSLVAWNLIIVGVFMIFVERSPVKSKLKNLKMSNSLLIGIAQTLALMPGVSRSGITIATGRLAGLNDNDSAHFSFLMAIPIIIGATIKVLLDGSDGIGANLDLFAVGIISAFISGYLAIAFMLNFLKKHGLQSFGVYRIVLGAVLLLFIV